MKIFIVGLGLIGASYAEGLHHRGHKIYAYNRNEAYVKTGVTQGFIEQDNALKKLSACDLVILALYPEHNVSFVKENLSLFKRGQVVTDVSGTKIKMMEEIEQLLPQGVSYTSHHPMAGKETSGFESRDYNIFKKANFLIVRGKKSEPKDEILLREVANDLRFGKITVLDAKTHDELIAFTSQLTHVLAVALVQSDTLTQTKEATGDSYRDLTRIAKINEIMWSELFLENRDLLLQKIDDFEHQLNTIKNLIKNNQIEALQAYLKQAKERRKTFDLD
jgi:prephenate dehydrogenase